MRRLATFGALVAALLSAGCSSGQSSAEDKAFATFAHQAQRDLDRATHPTESRVISANQLVQWVDRLNARRDALRAQIDSSSGEPIRGDAARSRIELIKIERQLELIERLLTRYEQNAPAVARGG